MNLKEKYQIFTIIFEFLDFSVKKKIAHIQFTQNSIFDIQGRPLKQLIYDQDILDYIYNTKEANEQA